MTAGPSRPKSHRIENSEMEKMRASLKRKITSEIENSLVEPQRDLIKLLKHKNEESTTENLGPPQVNETRELYIPIKTSQKN